LSLETWLLTKAVCALAELTVIVLWLIRRVAPAGPPVSRRNRNRVLGL